MDQNLLVKSGHVLVLALDNAGIPPRAAMWVHSTDTDTWKLWLVPHKSVTDKRDFYRQLSAIVTKSRDELGGVDAADVEMVSDAHPAIKGMRRLIKMPGLGDVHLTNNRFNNFYLPDGIVLRMDIS